MKINMAKLRSVGDTKLIQLNTEADKLLKQNVWPVDKITKTLAQQMFNDTSKLLDEYHKNMEKKCDELHKEFESKNLHSNILTQQNKKAKFNSLNETNHSNKKETNTMKKNTNTLITELDNTMLTSNVAQLTDAVNKILVRLDALEAKNVAPKHEFKKLRETAEEVKKETKKVKKVVKAKKANKEQKAEIVKLQKKAQEGKKSLTKKQLAQYTRMWHDKWYEINKKIDINDKAARSLAFAKGRIYCLKKARTY